MKFIIDMNLSPLWEDVLISAGFEAVHWSRVGAPNTSDERIMGYARAEGWIVLTHDLDFGTLLAYTGDKGPSVIQVREQDVDPATIGDAVLAAIHRCRDLLESGALVTVDLQRAKARVLPIRRTDS